MVVTNFPDEFDESTGDGRWKYEEVLGEGGFGVVHAALDRKNEDRKVAIKILRCGKDPFRHCLLGTKEVRQARLFEEKVFSQTKHRLFLRYLEDHTGLDKYSNEELAIFDKPDFDWEKDPRLKQLTVNAAPYLVMEFIPGRNVKMLLKEKCLNLEEIRELMHQAAAALWHMSQQKKIHRDFRVHNMMWNAGELTIIDFGLVLGVEKEHSHSKNRLIRTYWKLDSYWMPPEVKLALGRSSSKEQIANFVPCNFPEMCPFAFDMYSFGVVSLELLLEPQVNARMARNQNAIEQKGLKRLRPHDAVKYLDETRLKGVGLTRAIIQCCVSKNPSFRLTPVSLLQGFQSNFQTSKVAPKGHAQFMKKLEAACGKSRQDDGMKHLGHLAREIITKIGYVEQYAQALITFCEKPGVSIYRLLCIVDCAARFGAKIKDKNNLELLVAAFTPFIYRFAKQSKIVYETDSPSNRFNRLRVSEFLKKWTDKGLFPKWETYSDANKGVKQEVEENEKDKDKKVTSVSTHVPTTAHSGDLSSAQSFEVKKKPATTAKKAAARKPSASPPAKIEKSAAADEDSEEEGKLMSELAMARTLVDDDDIFNFMSKPAAAPAPVAKIVVEEEEADDAVSSKGFVDDDDEDLDKAPSVASDDHFSQMSISDMTVASPNDNDDDEVQMEVEEIEESAVQEVLESGEDDDEVEFLQENGEVISDDDEDEEEDAEELSWQSDASIKPGGKIIRKRGAPVQEVDSDDEESDEEPQILTKSKKKNSRIAEKPKKKKKAAVYAKMQKKEKKKKAPKRAVVQRDLESDEEEVSEASSSSGPSARRIRRPLPPQEVDSSEGEEESSDLGMRPVVPRGQMMRRSRTPPVHRSLSRSRSPPVVRRAIRGFSDSPEQPRYQRDSRGQRFRNGFNDSAGPRGAFHIPMENRPPPTRRMPPATAHGARAGNGGRYAASPVGRGVGGRNLSPFNDRRDDGPRRGNAAGAANRISLVPRDPSPQRGYYGGGYGTGYAQRVMNERVKPQHDYVQQGMFPMFPENTMAYATIPVARREPSWQEKRNNNKQWNLGIPWNRT